jgi:error-prone DNA polymerase
MNVNGRRSHAPKFVLVEGLLQNLDGVVHVKAKTVKALSTKTLEQSSRDFH